MKKLIVHESLCLNSFQHKMILNSVEYMCAHAHCHSCTLGEKMAYKVPKLPKSSKKIILLLSEAGTLTQKELIIRSNIPAKTVRYALKKLDEQDLIISTPNLEDMRSAFYTLNPDFNSVDMEMHINDARQVLYAELSN